VPERHHDDRTAHLLRDGRARLFFRSVARTRRGSKSPSVAIWLATGLGVLYVLENDFAQLADKFILGIWPF